ncbi:hypothetical protein ACFXTI_040172 [Malus domestica]
MKLLRMDVQKDLKLDHDCSVSWVHAWTVSPIGGCIKKREFFSAARQGTEKPPFPPAPWSLLPLHLLTPPTLPLPQSANGPSRFWLMMS